MCEVVEISDDEDFSVLENDVGIIPKDENFDGVCPPQSICTRPGPDNMASSSGSNFRSSFVGMGFDPSLVDKAIEENGEGNPDLLLETLFAHSDRQQPKTECFDDNIFSGDNSGLPNLPAIEVFHKSESSDALDGLFGAAIDKNVHFKGDFPLKVEPDVCSGASDEKMASLLKMNFSLDEVRFAIDRIGKDASIGRLMDFIFAARMAKKYPVPEDEDNKKDDNEALFGIMEKTLRLLEMGFTENEISAAFERCGSEAPLQDLAGSIVAPDTVPIAYKYSPASFSNSSAPNSLKRKMGDSLNSHSLDSLLIKTEETTSDGLTQAGTSDLLEKLKGKMPKEEYTDEPNNWKKPKEEIQEDYTNSVDISWLQAITGNSTSTSNRVTAAQRRFVRMRSLDEDIKSVMPIPNPSKSLRRVAAKPPYFLYGNVTNLSHNSWAKISQFLYSLQPELVNTQLYSALSRQEGYIHNLPSEDRFHIFPKGPMTIEEAIPHTRKWWPSWDNRKQLSYISCEMTGISLLCDRLERRMADSKGIMSAELEREILHQCETKNLIWVGKYKLAPLEPEQLERIMGYPVHHSRVAGFSSSERFRLLKLSFQTDTLAYHVSVLRRLFPEGLTVLSFFSGIGGAEVALHRLGIRLKGLVSVETCEIKRKIMKQWWERSGQSGELIQFESIHKLSRVKLEGLIKKLHGFDFVICQNPYSSVDSDNLAGLDFSMFVEFVRVLQHVRSTMERNK